MGKAPAFQFYPMDFDRDTAVLSLESVGGWMRILCSLWWSETRGTQTYSIDNWARILRSNIDQASEILLELKDKKVAEVTLGNGQVTQEVTVSCRRMVKEEKIRRQTAERKRRFDRASNGQVTQQKLKSNNASSSSSSNKEIYKEKFVPPTVQEVTDYAKGIGFDLDGESFVAHYAASGWMRGKSKIKDWRACVVTWKKNNQQFSGKTIEPRKFRTVDEVLEARKKRDEEAKKNGKPE